MSHSQRAIIKPLFDDGNIDLSQLATDKKLLGLSLTTHLAKLPLTISVAKGVNMPAYNNVLIAVDIYGNAEQVLERAMEVVDESTTVNILHVAFHSPYIYASYGVGGMVSDSALPIKDQVRVSALEVLHKLIENTSFANIKGAVEFGRAQDVIIAKAEELKTDLIIIGSHGRHGLALLLGSTANAVVHHASCDVLAVRIRD
jgi:universal stress protein A